MKDIKTIKDPEAFQLLADQTRRKIVFLLRVKEMTVSQIAGDLDVTPQAVYHHIRKLLKGELVEIAREERVGHLIESYYRATAECFVCSVGKTSLSAKVAKEQMTVALDTLKRLGFKLEFDNNKISQLVDLRSQLQDCCGSGKFEEAISEMQDVDFLMKQTVQEFADILSMSDEEFTRKQEARKKFRDMLVTLAKR